MTAAHTTSNRPAILRSPLSPIAWMLLGGFIALAAASMLANSGVQTPSQMPAIVTADSNAYLVTRDHRIYFLRGNAAVEVVGVPNNWR